MLSQRFIPNYKAVFYIQSVVRSPQSAVYSPQSAVLSPDRVNRHKRCLLRRYARRRGFITKTRTIILFTNTTLNRLGFRGTATGYLKRRTCWCTKAILWEWNSFPMWTLSLGLCYIIGAHKFRPAKWNYRFPPLIYSAESSVGFGRIKKRRGHTKRSQTTAFCSYKKSYTFPKDMSARFLNAMNTDFEL